MPLNPLARGLDCGNLCRMPTDDNPRKTSGPDEPAPTVMDPTRLPSQDELIGQVLNGRYLIQHEIKRGGMGVVYLARDPRLDRTVALKILPGELATDADRMQRFTREAKAASALNHPNVATIYDVGETVGWSFAPIIVSRRTTIALSRRTPTPRRRTVASRIRSITDITSFSRATGHSVCCR